MAARPTNPKLARQVAALAKRLRAGPRPTSHADPALDELAALIAQGLSRRTFLDDVAREMCDGGLHVDPAALADALTRPTLH